MVLNMHFQGCLFNNSMYNLNNQSLRFEFSDRVRFLKPTLCVGVKKYNTSNWNFHFWIFDGPKFENLNMHFRIFDRPAPVKYPKMHILIVHMHFGIHQTANIKLQIEISSFEIVTDQNSKIKICILSYLIGQRQSNIKNQNMHFGNLNDLRADLTSLIVRFVKPRLIKNDQTANWN